MIVAETGDGFQFVTQPAHARLAGQFADHWGNEAFTRPEPVAVVVAAYTHDDGWWTYDQRPHLGSDGRPVDFREMPADVWTGLYDEGVETVVGLDRYAGLLVSMHGSGLRRRRYGLSPSWPATPEEFESFVDRQENRQTRLLDELRAENRVSDADARLLSALHETGSAPDGADSRLWRNYRLLQAWDTLSLAFCVTDSPPGYSRIDGVPTGRNGEGDGDENGREGGNSGASEARLSIDSVGEHEYRIDPYPFETSPLVVSVPVRTVDPRQFEDDAHLRRAYYRSAVENRSFTLRR